MAKKQNGKKKGPKGKKARKAAKLERQWGEEADEEEIKRAKYRKGKRRLNEQDSEARIKYEKLPRLTYNDLHTYGGSESAKEGEERNDGIQMDNVDYDSDDSSESSVGFNEDASAMNGDQFALTSLLKKINKGENKKKSSSKNGSSDGMHEIENDDESIMEEDGSTQSEDEVEYDSDINSDEEGGDLENFKLEPIGSNPFLSHFTKEPLTANEIDKLQNTKKLKKVTVSSLNANLVLQSSVKSMFENDESKKDMIAKAAKQSFSHVHQLLMENWGKLNKRTMRKSIDTEDDEDDQNSNILTSLQASIYAPLSKYADVQITCANRENHDAINHIVALHALNHVLTANRHITIHNNKIRELESTEGDDIDNEDEWRDQGYTRPKVLILLPTRSTAWYFVQDVLKMIGNESSIENLERFDGEFGDLDEAPETDERRKKILKAKGHEWNDLFGDHVNSDDDFKIGISFSKLKQKSKKKAKEENRVAMKLFADFYHSDIIIASPMGLKVLVAGEDDDEADSDFLSSLEIVAALQSDVMLMQNWDHVVGLMEHINQQPKKSSHTDFSRVRNYLLEGQASHWRQLILTSGFNDPHFQSMFGKHAKSFVGQTKLRRKVPTDDSSICNVTTKVRQVFQRVPCESFSTQGDKRIRHFVKNVLPQLLQTKQKHTLIYIPSYFDFVVVRNVLLKHDIASNHFVSITEYSRGSEVSRGRARFLQGRKRLMLYTGRAHYFMRHQIKGARHLIMLGIPEHANFYPELLNMLGWRPKVNELDDENEFDISAPASCLNLFTKYEVHSLERIVGTKHAERMIKSEKNTHLFSS